MIEDIGMEIFEKAWPMIVKAPGGQIKKIYQNLRTKVTNGSHQYDKNYRERHGQLKVFCVGMREPIPLDDVYVAIQVLDERSASKYGSNEDIEKAFRERNRSRLILSSDELKDGTQVANEKRHLMLLGAPGIGKSTFLRKVGLEALKGKEGNFVHKCIPVFLELKRFTGDQIDIEALIAQEFKICGYPYPEEMAKTALNSGKLLILFDGLDEVPTANVDNVVLKIGDFVDQYSQNRFIASCRIAAYTGGFRQFTEVEMADFDDTQIEAYIKNWFASTPDRYRYQLDEEVKTADQCWKALNAAGHHATKELARNPLLLTLLCMVYDNSQNFPQNRADLYEKALNIFLEEWAAEKRVRQEDSISQYLDVASEKRMLSEIAAKNFEASYLLFSKDELIKQIREFGEGNANTPSTFDAPKIFETILVDQGLFVERVSGSYSFSHLTFQEYLTASYIKEVRSIQRLVTNHLHDKRWREVFLLTAGLMHTADDLLEAMKKEAAKSLNTDGLKRLLRWAEHITDTVNDGDNGFAKRVFAIRQCVSLSLLNKIYEEVKTLANQYPDFDINFSFYQNEDFDIYKDLSLCRNFYQYLWFYQSSDPYLNLNFHLYKNRDREQEKKLCRELCSSCDRTLKLFLRFYLDRQLNFSVTIIADPDIRVELCPHTDLYLYQDFYRYMDTDYYASVSSEFGDRFDEELDNRISFVERMEQAHIFKEVDLQRMARRFEAQREFIKAVREGKSADAPEESIHDTWLSVLHIADDILAISREEMESYLRYLRAVELIFLCKRAAGRVTPQVWEQIMEKILKIEDWQNHDV